MALRLAMEWLGSCSGCEIAFLNIGEKLISMLTGDIEIVHSPLLMDNKYTGPENKGPVTLPSADIGFVSGGVSNEEHLTVLQEMREKCDFLVALGTCATHGGIPALMNGQDGQQAWREIFAGEDGEGMVPRMDLPAPLDRVYAVDEKIEVDLMLPGCAPNPRYIEEVLDARLEERPPSLPGRSVCDACPVVRKGKGDVAKVKRFLVNADYDPNSGLDEMRCFLEQGYLCLGPVTLAGCTREGAPSCIVARVPCRGCFGPVRSRGNQLLDMMNAMTSNRIDYKSVEDRRSILRFSGGHGRLKPLKKR